MPNLLFCIHQRNSEGIGGSEGESGWLSGVKGVVGRVIWRNRKEEVSDESIQEELKQVKVVVGEMFSQLEEEVCYVGRKGFWTIPIKDGNGGASVNDRVTKVNFGGRKVKDRGDTESDETEGLEVRKRSPLEIMICTNEKGRRGKTSVKGREGPII